jgi:Ras-related GTP-binding protein A/B
VLGWYHTGWFAVDVEHTTVRFMGDLVLNLWDCGGQQVFYQSYFEAERDSIFKDVAVLIFVFDIKSREIEEDLHNYERCLDAIGRDSKSAKIFCLIHKMDAVPLPSREVVFSKRESDIVSKSGEFDVRCFPTSIWNETLYKVGGCLCVLRGECERFVCRRPGLRSSTRSYPT